MAEIRKITRSNPISQFRQVAPAGGIGMAVVAEALDAAYSRLAPAAEKQMAERGAEHGRELARQHIGANRAASLALSAGVSDQARAALEALQASWGRELRITSDHRTPEQNAAVGGAKNSEHLRGNAFDIDVSGLSQEDRVALIGQARAAGFGGIGVYDNSLHFDVGPTRHWGPSYGADSLPSWAAAAVGAPRGALPQGAPQQNVVTTTAGKVEPRLYSPYSGPILQAHNAAAEAAYRAEMLVSGAQEMLSLSARFPLDPDGFQQAAQGYIDELVAKAPAEFRSALREDLTQQANRQQLGIMEDRQRDIRQRAANSTKALIDRYSGQYAEALASGDEATATDALARLDETLAVMERLPGQSWTPEQSENARIAAQDAAERIAADRLKAASADIKDGLRTVIEARKNGMVAADEGLLNNPLAAQVDPDLFAEAQAWVAARELFPSFDAATPGERGALLGELAAEPVVAGHEVDIRKALAARDKELRTMWRNDPIDAASQVLPEKPPPLPDLTSENEGDFVKALSARRAYAESLVTAGYIDAPVLLSKAEADSLALGLSVSSPPQVRAALAAGLVAGFGDKAMLAFNQMGNIDQVTRMAGTLLARGGDMATATDAFRGQQMLAEKLAVAPPMEDRVAALTPDIRAALAHVPQAEAVQSDILALAVALHANNPEGKLEDAVQRALGQTVNPRGQKVGGVQKVFDAPTLLPMGVSSAMVEGALTRALTTTMVLDTNAPLAGQIPEARAAQAAMWTAATQRPNDAGGIPYLASEPMTAETFHKFGVRLIPLPGGYWSMEARSGEQVTDANGYLFMFRLTDLIEAAQ